MKNNTTEKLIISTIAVYSLLFLCFMPFSGTVAAQPEEPGPFPAGWMQIDLQRDGRVLSSRIYYPALYEGSDAPIDTINKPYQAVGFGHGFFMQTGYYISLYEHLATHGYVVIAPQFPYVNHLQLGFDLLYCVNYIKSENNNPSSIFYGLIDTTGTGLFGHSLGGGASLLASAHDTTITVAAPLSAAETTPSAINLMNQIKGVVYLISAQNDGITPVNSHQQPMFDNANPIKGIPVIRGANHTKYMDTRIWDWTDPGGYLSPAEQQLITRRYLTSIFNLFLKQDTTYWKYTFGEIAQNDTSIILNFELKPLIPQNFNLIFPLDTLSSNDVTFTWESTYSLNLNDIIQYRIDVSENESFDPVLISQEGLTDTSYYAELNPGIYFWRVLAYTSDSTAVYSPTVSFVIESVTGVEDVSSRLPRHFQLNQNFPNPFNNQTVISYFLAEDAPVKLEVYDLLGRKITTLVDDYQAAGEYRVPYKPGKVSSGVYYYRLNTGALVKVRRMLLLR